MTVWRLLHTHAKTTRSQAQWLRRYQSTSNRPNAAISSILLGRARTLAAEHAQLSQRLNDQYDSQIAKKAGALSAVADAVKQWEAVSNVCIS